MMENLDRGSGVDVCGLGVEVMPHREVVDFEDGNSPDMQCMDLIAHASLPPTIEDGLDGCVQGETCYRIPTRTIQTMHTVVSSNKISVVSVVEEPKEGMIFKTWQDVEAYYKKYAEQLGFGVISVQGSFSKKDKERRGTTWKCECWGRPNMRAVKAAKKRAKSMEVAGCSNLVGGVIAEPELNCCKRKSKKCECGAKIYASVNDDGE
ncbi:uncharacterized protein LOC110718846 [Chenopodium quinoa]|uniref:uncharacterized protein LOC110718846 n=1 Tax=Chenopodium quinoa TaxID=63459 RepID=UPI000B775713|nr:uncharacterized protein LOC110718846 [Chenopodium quinoa]